MLQVYLQSQERGVVGIWFYDINAVVPHTTLFKI